MPFESIAGCPVPPFASLCGSLVGEECLVTAQLVELSLAAFTFTSTFEFGELEATFVDEDTEFFVFSEFD